MAHMKQEYGPDKGERVFYASRNAGRITGVDPGHADGGLVAGLARGGIVDHDYDPELPHNREDDAQLIPLTEAYSRTIQTLRANEHQPQAGLGQVRGFAAGGDTGAKLSQQQVNYRRGYPLRQCGLCSMFRKNGAGDWGTCTDVAGRITPYGLCRIFKQLDNPYGNKMHRDHRREMEKYYCESRGEKYD